MRILHIIQSFGVGGAEILLANLLPELKQHGDEVAVAVMRGPFVLRPRLEEQGVRVITMTPRHRWNLLGAAWELGALVRSGDYSVIHAHLYFPGVTVALCRCLGLIRAASVVTFHNLAYAQGVNKAGCRLRLRKSLAAMLYSRGFDAKLAVSGAVANHYQQVLGLHDVQVLHNPIPHSLSERRINSIHRPHRLDCCFKMLVPGRLVHEKGHVDFLQALALLRAEGRNIYITFAGGGPLKEVISEAVREMGLEDRVVITGAVEHVQMLEAMEAADLVVVPSRFEGFGLTALEAMALGRPVVATTAGGLPEVIEHGVSGWLVPPQEPVGLAKAIAELMDNDPLRARLAENGRLRAQERFSMSVFIEQLRDIYLKAIQDRQAMSPYS